MKIPSTAELVERFVSTLRSAPEAVVARVGVIELTVVDSEPRPHRVAVGPQGITATPGKAPDAKLRIGAQRSALYELLEGTLDVAAAFAEQRLAMEGSEDT